MPRTPLARLVKTLFHVSSEASERELPVSAIWEERAARSVSRRGFLDQTARVMAGATVAGASGSAWAARPRGSVVIVGAGLAGLTCAYRLQQAGVTARLYEAAPRLGGRCLTRRDYFAEGQQVERGGELIDTGHRAIRMLARELGLALDDVNAAQPAGTEDFFRFFGETYSVAQATADFLAIQPTLRADLKAAGYPTTYNASTPRGRQLDALSISDYVNAVVPGGRMTPLGQLLEVAYNIEFGAEAEDQSALNLLYLLGYSAKGQFQIFGESDERFHIRGGNDQVVSGLAARLESPVELGHELVALRRRPDGRVELTFQAGGSPRVVTADQVVLALPFSILRHSVDYSGAGLSALKQIAIAEQGMGANCKFQLQFHHRHWHGLGNNGATYADTGYQNTWEVTRAQGGQAGILNNYTGGNIARAYNRPVTQLVPQVLAQLEPVLPGLSAEFNGRATLDYWPGYRWTRGSYAYWRVGQYARFAGYEGVAEGNLHFCGEHTSIDFQGYLNGAVETGETVASEVRRAL